MRSQRTSPAAAPVAPVCAAADEWCAGLLIERPTAAGVTIRICEAHDAIDRAIAAAIIPTLRALYPDVQARQH